MVNSLKFWLASIIEDDPLPDEIKTIVFNVGDNGKFLTLSMFGYETILNINKMPYNPLEAQFFFDKNSSKLPIQKYLIRLKNSLDECFIDKQLYNGFYKRKIYIRYKGEETFLFEVK